MALETRVFLEEDSEYLSSLDRCQPIGFGDRPAILVVDMSYAFVAPCGSRGEDCVSNVSVLLEAARMNGVPVLFSRVGLSRDPAVSGRWKNRSQIRGIPELQEVVDQLGVRADEVTIPKYMPSVFQGTELHSCLEQRGVDTLIVCGLVTSGCVRATVVDAFSRNYRVVVPVECVADPCQTSHEVSLIDMHSRYADVINLQEVLDYIGKNKNL